MGSDADSGGIGAGASNIIGCGKGNTFNITGSGCTVENLAFRQDTPSSQIYPGSIDCFLNFSTCTEIRVRNVHMQYPNIGITLTIGNGVPGQFWIEDLLIEGQMSESLPTPVGGILATVGNATLYIKHVVMDIVQPGPDFAAVPQPQFGIRVQSAGELVICAGTDIIGMGECLSIRPSTNQYVIATYVSDSFFDSGNINACVLVAPGGTGYVRLMRFANVWTSTGNNGLMGTPVNAANGFRFDGSLSTAEYPLQDVSLVNCLAQGFHHAGLYAANMMGLSVTSSTFGGNYDGILITSTVTDIILNGNKCGYYVADYGPGVGNADYGLLIQPGCVNFIVIGNLCYGNTVGSYYPSTTIVPNMIVQNNLP